MTNIGKRVGEEEQKPSFLEENYWPSSTWQQQKMRRISPPENIKFREQEMSSKQKHGNWNYFRIHMHLNIMWNSNNLVSWNHYLSIKTNLTNWNSKGIELFRVLPSWFCGIIGHKNQLLPLNQTKAHIFIYGHRFANQTRERQRERDEGSGIHALDRSNSSVSETPSMSLSPFQITPKYTNRNEDYFKN